MIDRHTTGWCRATYERRSHFLPHWRMVSIGSWGVYLRYFWWVQLVTPPPREQSPGLHREERHDIALLKTPSTRGSRTCTRHDSCTCCCDPCHTIEVKISVFGNELPLTFSFGESADGVRRGRHTEAANATSRRGVVVILPQLTWCTYTVFEETCGMCPFARLARQRRSIIQHGALAR